MNEIRIKYNVGDRVLFKKSVISGVAYHGTIKKYLIESTTEGHNVCYYIECRQLVEGIVKVSAQNVLSLANNVSNFTYFEGDEANKKVENVLKNINFNIEIKSITFEGNRTKLVFKREGNPFFETIISECHPDDDFTQEKGVEACLYKAMIKHAERKLRFL